MARTAGSEGPRTEMAIRLAAVDLIAARGFEAVTLRSIAQHINIQAGTIYRYFPSKGSLLMSLVSFHMEELFARWEEADPGPVSAVKRLETFIAHHVDFHATKPKEVLIANTEIRSLDPKDREVVVLLRKRYEQIVIDILQTGVNEGVFSVPDVRVTSYAILAMLTGLTAWYQEGGRLSQDQLAACYTRLVMTGVQPTV